MLEPTAYLTVGAMARLVDVPKAFAIHPGPARAGVKGRIGLDLTDPIFKDQSRAFDVTFGARGAKVEPGDGARDRVRVDVTRLAQIYFASAPAVTLLAQGLIEGSARAATLLDTAFAGPPLFLGPANFF
jgi:predicted acetyltransferase